MTVQGYRSSEVANYSKVGSIFRMASLNDRKIERMSKEYARGAVNKTPIGFVSNTIFPGAVLLLSRIYTARKGKLDSGSIAKFSDKLLTGAKYSGAVLLGANAAGVYTDVVANAFASRGSENKKEIKHPYSLATAIFAGAVGIFALSFSLVKSGAKHLSNTKLWAGVANKLNKGASTFAAKHKGFIDNTKKTIEKHPKIASFMQKHAVGMTILGFFGATMVTTPMYMQKRLEIQNNTKADLTQARDDARLSLALYCSDKKIKDGDNQSI